MINVTVADESAVDTPYLVPSIVERKKFQASQQQTTYIYDFLPLFQITLENVWKEYRAKDPHAKVPAQLMKVKELALGANNDLVEVEREVGRNTIGMVAWRMTLSTPAYPNGQDIIVIGNDITFEIGSFGPREDLLFAKASQLARRDGIPRIYLAANSGARIGLAEELKDKFKVSWLVPSEPSRGFLNLYLSDDDYQSLIKSSDTAPVLCTRKADKWEINDIIGKTDGLGVENLRGSGLIAGETSLAYDQTFTLTVVTGRTVGIGAYLVRLGERTIQNQGNQAPIILTGASALNKVLGRNVYLSNVQLGGTQIMYENGVTHMVTKDDFGAVQEIMQWLSYLPERRGQRLPLLLPGVDPIDRKIGFTPTKQPYDPRHFLEGVYDAERSWTSGFFDQDSWHETLGGWGKTVVCGRARLGGIPLGVIAVETRTVEKVIPADPAVATSHETVIQQAGQVWFPDSAYKTAQCIKDFNREELPLMIFANWRGFSGGLMDLYGEVLKFGSYIVDALVEYKQPVTIYIPPCGELRGGAWVVVDPLINPQVMEMYADPTARGGVLEPSGTVEIKFKERDLIKTMHRLDEQLMSLDAQLKANKNDIGITSKIQHRERELMTMYGQIATTFADLHDTPGRMKAKECIREIVPWQQARPYFYNRLRRRMEDEYLRRQFNASQPKPIPHAQLTDTIQRCFKESLVTDKHTNNKNNNSPKSNNKGNKTSQSPSQSPVPATDSASSSPALTQTTSVLTLDEEKMWNDDVAVYSWLQKNPAHWAKWVSSHQPASAIDAAVDSLLKALQSNTLNAAQQQQILSRVQTALKPQSPSPQQQSPSTPKQHNNNQRRQQQKKKK